MLRVSAALSNWNVVGFAHDDNVIVNMQDLHALVDFRLQLRRDVEADAATEWKQMLRIATNSIVDGHPTFDCNDVRPALV